MHPLQATARSTQRATRQQPRELQQAPPTIRLAVGRPLPGAVLLRACRPRQWVKNVLVAIAPGAAGALTRPAVVAEVIGAFFVFSLLSSATYLVNDVRDRELDRQHPRKRLRPIAAGELSPRGALRIAAVMAVGGLALAFLVQPALAIVGLCYLALTTSYSMFWRQVVVADILAVAGGFLLRAAAGGAATDVRLSRSFLVVTSACALFLVAGKRYAELTAAGTRRPTRATLGRYTRPLLRRLLAGAAVLGCLAYARWAFWHPGLGPWFELSMIPFVMWLGRYAVLLGAGAGESPEELILRDPALLACGAAWLVLLIGGVYVAH
jgi:decaprenyl-phosphate phosphoribosyltransferase